MNLLEANGIRFDPATGHVEGANRIERRLSALRGSFVDDAAYERALTEDDPVVYTVASVEPSEGEGQLHFGVGVLMPGRVGKEYYLTKGHLHTWRAAAELYIGLRGTGIMLLEDEVTGESQSVPLTQDSTVYVPGHTAHRTINTGEIPLIYMGVYPAEAGHDYAFIQQRNFRQIVVARNGKPVCLDRKEYLKREA